MMLGRGKHMVQEDPGRGFVQAQTYHELPYLQTNQVECPWVSQISFLRLLTTQVSDFYISEKLFCRKITERDFIVSEYRTTKV